jgi:hypothetical protein
MDIPIQMPYLERQKGNLFIQKSPLTDGGNTFPANSIVQINSGALRAVPTGGVAAYGWANSPSRSATIAPPDSLPLGLADERHYPFDPEGAIFVLNITDASGNIGEANGAPTLAEAVIGSEFGIHTATNGVQFVNVDETTDTLFKVVGWVDGQSSTDYNGKVYVQIIPSKIQG